MARRMSNHFLGRGDRILPVPRTAIRFAYSLWRSDLNRRFGHPLARGSGGGLIGRGRSVGDA